MPTPPPPSSFDSGDLRAAGFVGWTTGHELRAAGFASVPSTPAVYLVYRPENTSPTFLAVNPAGHFRGKDPTIVGWALQANWVPNAHVVYIGGSDDVKPRLDELARYGAGEAVGHPGGRYIWQLADSAELLVAWHEITWGEAARDYERRLVKRFMDLYGGAVPFANLDE
jgi:hypothetical protein